MISKPINRKPIKEELRAVLYGRVSDASQVEGTSLAEQHAACTTKAQHLNAQVVGYYEDAGVSGGLYLARPGIQAALADLESGKANVLIIAKLDRYSRDREHQTAIKKRVELAGARLIFCDVDFADTPEGDLQFGILGSFAEYERKVIRERCMKGARRRALEGIQTKTAFAPFGYYIPNKSDVFLGAYAGDQYGKYQIVEEQAAIVRSVFEKIENGDSMHAVARWLNEQGTATPRNGEYWRCSTLKRIINNPVYKGKAPYGRHQKFHDESRLKEGFKQPFVLRERPAEDWIYIDCPALVSEKTWDVCQEILQGNKSRHGGRPERRYTLSGLLRCPKCNRTMHATKRIKKRSPGQIAKGSGKHPYLDYRYACRDSRPSRNTGGCQCNARNYSGNKAERCVFEAVKYAAQQTETTAAALQAFYNAKRTDFSASEYNELERKLKELERREGATIEAQIRGLTIGANVSVYEDILRQIAKQRTEAKHKLEEVAQQRVSVTDADCMDAAQIISQALQAVEEVFEVPELTDGEKRDFLARVVDSVYPTDDLETYAVNLKPFTHDALTVANVSRLCPPAAATSSARLTLS